MDRLIRHRVTIHFLLLMLLGQFIGTAWSCPMETAPESPSASLHGEHQAHMRTDEHTENSNAFSSASLGSEQESSEVAPCCGDDDSTCPTHHCSALNLTYLFETQETPPADKPQSLSYKNPIKRVPTALYRPPIASLTGPIICS